jgi:voltage-gated potassium channel
MLVILGGVGAVLYTLGVVVEAIVEGRLADVFGRRRMDRQLADVVDHLVVCGWGRVGRAIAANLGGGEIVVIDRDPARADLVPGLVVEGDATDDDVLARAGIARAKALVAALDTDADNLYVTLSARRLRPDLFIVARARVDAAAPKLLQAGADRVVNPQSIGGARMAALVNQPHVADFLDVVMHDGSLEFRLEEVTVGEGSALAGTSIGDAHVRATTGALVLAVRQPDGSFRTNPPAGTVLQGGDVLIAIGTAEQIAALVREASGRGR